MLGSANLTAAFLAEADLRGASLARAQMQGAWLGMAKLDGATLRRAALWRSGAPNASIHLTDFSELDQEEAFAVQDIDRKAGEVRDIIASLPQGASWNQRQNRARATESLGLLLMRVSPEQEARLHAAWPVQLPMEPPPPMALAEFLADLACRDDDAHHVAARLVRQLAESASSAGRDLGTSAAAFGDRLSRPETCPGAHGLNGADRAYLAEIAARAPLPPTPALRRRAEDTSMQRLR